MGYNRNLVVAKKRLEAQQNSQWDGVVQCSQCLDKLGFGLKRKAVLLGCRFPSLRNQLVKRGLHKPKDMQWNRGLRTGYKDAACTKPHNPKTYWNGKFKQAVKRFRKEALKNFPRVNRLRQDGTRVKKLQSIKDRMRATISRILRESGEHKRPRVLKFLGCTIPQARAYIASLFKEGMTWDNHGEWEIDHIKELSSFNLADARQRARANHYTNLQPLWKEEHKTKTRQYMLLKHAGKHSRERKQPAMVALLS